MLIYKLIVIVLFLVILQNKRKTTEFVQLIFVHLFLFDLFICRVLNFISKLWTLYTYIFYLTTVVVRFTSVRLSYESSSWNGHSI